MNITFLIGNGFDMGLGMKSSFKDFFPIYKESFEKEGKPYSMLAQSINDDENKWSYFERQLGFFTEKFTLETADSLVEQIRHFELKFTEYLVSQESELDFSDENRINKMMLSALKNYYSSSKLPTESANSVNSVFNKFAFENHLYHFINFNYTGCLSKCLNTIENGVVGTRQNGLLCDKIGQIIHVHGYLQHNPIMGLNDLDQIENPDLRGNKAFTKGIVKPLQNQAIRMGYDRAATDLINNSTIICVYGMSLGETDKKWWVTIINWLQKNTNRQLILFDYDEHFNRSSQFDWIKKEDAVIEKMSSFYNDKETIEHVRERIHLAVHKNIFSLNLAKKIVLGVS